MKQPKLFERWHEVADASGAVVIVHGFAEHSGRYAHVIAELNDNGYSAFAFDYRGWGQAEGPRGYVHDYREYLDDVQWAVEQCAQRSGQVPFLLGHSQGGLLAALFAIDRPTELRGLVLSSPAMQFAMHVPWWKRVFGQLASRILPQLSLPSGLDATLLTHDITVLAAMQKDPLLVRKATARWYTETLNAQQRTLAEAERVALPTLLLVAGDDHIVDHSATKTFFERCAAKDKTWKGYDGAYHEVFNELPKWRKQAFADLIAWFAER